MASINRIVMQKNSRQWVRSLGPKGLDVAEISGRWGKMFDFYSYQTFFHPEFDICDGPFLDEDGAALQFDLILANQVWEHLDRPYAAVGNVLKMLRKGGYFWLATPFFIPYHAAPIDCSRWSARGLKNLLVEAGFHQRDVQAFQWGNRHVAERNLEPDWPPDYDQHRDDLANDPDFPVMAWAMGRKS